MENGNHHPSANGSVKPSKTTGKVITCRGKKVQIVINTTSFLSNIIIIIHNIITYKSYYVVIYIDHMYWYISIWYNKLPLYMDRRSPLSLKKFLLSHLRKWRSGSRSSLPQYVTPIWVPGKERYIEIYESNFH